MLCFNHFISETKSETVKESETSWGKVGMVSNHDDERFKSYFQISRETFIFFKLNRASPYSWCNSWKNSPHERLRMTITAQIQKWQGIDWKLCTHNSESWYSDFQ